MTDNTKAMTYLVTGAGRGIGRGLVRHLLAKGNKVFLTDTNETELQNTLKLASTTSWIKTSTSSSSFIRGKVVDLSQRDQIRNLVSEVAEFDGGRLDCLVNNAFATPHTWSNGRRMEDHDDEDTIMQEWDKKVSVGLTAPFMLSRLCVPLLIKAKERSGQPGCIVNISSTRALQAEDDHEAYSACKAGLLGLTRSSAISLGHRHNIRVNAILPGWISVDAENLAGDEAGMKWEEGMSESDHAFHPAGRVGKVEDIAKALDFLVDSPFFTGQDIVIDGGVTKKMVYPEE